MKVLAKQGTRSNVPVEERIVDSMDDSTKTVVFRKYKCQKKRRFRANEVERCKKRKSGFF